MTIWRHIKRGTTYQIMGHGLLQTSEPLQDLDRLIIYRDTKSGKIWVRPDHEFFDGRFRPEATQARWPWAAIALTLVAVALYRWWVS